MRVVTTHTSEPPADDPDRTPSFSGENRSPLAGEASPALAAIDGTQLGNVFPVPLGLSLVGRDRAVDVCIPDLGVSRKHAHVRRRGPLVTVTDVGSRNGTFVNDGRVMTPYVLSPGDRVRFGPYAEMRLVMQDPIDLKVQGELYARATLDPLTGLANRRAFDDRLAAEWTLAARQKRACGVCVLDVDRFKSINDGLGHLAGDAVLQELARVLRGLVRGGDLLARIGGEELGILVRGARSCDDLRAAAVRLRAAVEAHRFAWKGQPLAVTVSVGVAVARASPKLAAAALLAAADAAMYRAKREGRNRVAVAP